MDIYIYRLYDVIHTDDVIFLVFEYLDQDLKKYMDSVQGNGLPPELTKVFHT